VRVRNRFAMFRRPPNLLVPAPVRAELLLVVAGTALASGLFLLIYRLTGHIAPLLAYFPAFVLMGWYGRLASGLLAVGLATGILALYWLHSPVWLVLARLDGTTLALFAALGSLIVVAFNRCAEAIRELARTEQRLSIDVTSLHEAQVQTARARSELQAVADLMASGVALYSRDLRYRWASRRYLEWLGRSAEQVIGQPMERVLGPSLFGVKQPYIERVLAGESVTFEHEVDTPRGLRRWVHIAYTPEHNAEGQVDGWVGVITDITERRRTEEALRESDRRKDEFLATLAHELRNPMAAIRYAAPLIRADAAPGALEQARGAIERQSQQMTRLLDGLLDMSRITRNVIQLKLETLDLRTVTQEALDAARPHIETGRHQLVVSMPPQPVWVQGDLTRLLQIIGNLLSNACKYTPPGGRIEVRLEPDGQTARLCVRDTGVGLAPEMLPEVFELFAQVHKGLTVSSGGLGIGLAVSKRLTELHGGSIQVRSEGLGRGAEFSVRLPCVASPAQRSAGGDKVVTLFQGEPRVLIVDDNRDAADNLAWLLRSHGLHVQVAYDGMRALELAQAMRPSVVLLDIGLPDLNGLEVARRLRHLPWASQLALIAVTGWGQPEDRRETRAAGIDVHLVKPVDPVELLRVIQSLPQVSRVNSLQG